MGFTAEHSQSQQKLEARFSAIPSPDEARRHHRFFTAEPHPAGSERNNELARHIADVWKQQGMEDVTLHRYDVLNTSPREVVVEMVEPVRYKATLREDSYDVDPDTANPRVSSAYAGMSASGEITAAVVYAHSGNPADYDLLRRRGIDVRGKIVLVRYSNPYSYRGFKALTAQKEGAAALLIYSDPAEDGFKRGKVFPDGPWGPESHIQRGAITYDFLVPGDPLAPGWASVPGAKQIPREDAISLPKVIAVPLSWRDAKPLLENLDGPVAPKNWQGGLPLRYRLGGGRVRAHLKVDMDNSVKPNYVVESRIRGSELPDEWIVLGNHRDAWEFGGVDPSSGTASMMELTRALGELLKEGFRPRRTLVICSWDGEEVGLTGSTEWGEQFLQELRENAVAYINVDSSTSGPDLEAGAVASLSPFLVETSHALDDPSGSSLYGAWKRSAARTKSRKAVPDAELVNTKIGSGSDHTVFLNHAGVPSILLGFDGPYGVYHSVYDDFYWMNHFGDPGYKYHALMSRLWGVLALRLANADVLPFDFAEYARQLRGFVQALEKENPKARSKLDTRSLYQSLAAFESAGRRFDHAVARVLSEGGFDPKAAKRLNRSIRQVELNWLHEEGIPGRPWFKHLLYGARYTYAHLELPGVTEAVEKGNWEAAQQQGALVEAAVRKNAQLLDDAAGELRPPKSGP